MLPLPASHYVVQVEEGRAHGGLFELEQTLYYHVVDTRTQQAVMTFEGEVSASLSRSTGQWDDYHYSGVEAVVIAPDGRSALVRYHDGRAATVPLPP